jgi:hypothetical protein
MVRWDWYFKQLTPYEAGFQAGGHLKRFPNLEFIVGG